MSYEYKSKTIMVNHGVFEVGTYGKYSYRAEILHQFDSYVYGNSEKEVVAKLKRVLTEKESDAKTTI